MSKPIIIHFIYDLGLGGAEKMLVNSIDLLNDYDHILVLLNNKCRFIKIPFLKIYCLNCPSTLHIPLAVIKLRKIINQNKPAIVHSHLPLPNIIARFATPSKITLFASIHTMVSKSIAYTKLHIKWLEKFSVSIRRCTYIFVSETVKKDYETFFGIKSKESVVLYTYAIKNHAQINKLRVKEKLRMVTLGIKKSKNTEFLLECLYQLNDHRIELDIYGDGTIPKNFYKIKNANLPVYYKGLVADVEKLFSNYDYYISASKFEGFSLSVLEAMAQKLTLILSDIPSFREQSNDAASFFALKDLNSLKEILIRAIDHPDESIALAEKGFNRFSENFTLEHYVRNLVSIYDSVITCKS